MTASIPLGINTPTESMSDSGRNVFTNFIFISLTSSKNSTVRRTQNSILYNLGAYCA